MFVDAVTIVLGIVFFFMSFYPQKLTYPIYAFYAVNLLVVNVFIFSQRRGVGGLFFTHHCPPDGFFHCVRRLVKGIGGET